MALDPSRTVAELQELRELTGDENGAQRVAWTDTWETAREWLRGSSRGPARRGDRRGRQPVVHARREPRAARSLIGGHLDSVPNGGWLDGSLNVVAGAEVLRRIAEEGTPPVPVRLVNWADEEGARFGRSLFGSSAAAGSMRDQDELRKLTDRDGIALPDALREHGVDLDRALEARSQLEGAGAYLELHIEQGPVLESLDLPLGRRARDVRRRALADHLARPGGALRLDADGPAPRRARRRREARARHPRDRGRGRRRRGLHLGRRRLQAGDRHLGRRDGRAAARPAPSRRGRRSPRMLARREGGLGALRRRRSGSRSSGSRSGTSSRSSSTTRLIGFADEAIHEVAGASHRLPSARCTTPPRCLARACRR